MATMVDCPKCDKKNCSVHCQNHCKQCGKALTKSGFSLEYLHCDISCYAATVDRHDFVFDDNLDFEGVTVEPFVEKELGECNEYCVEYCYYIRVFDGEYEHQGKWLANLWKYLGDPLPSHPGDKMTLLNINDKTKIQSISSWKVKKHINNDISDNVDDEELSESDNEEETRWR